MRRSLAHIFLVALILAACGPTPASDPLPGLVAATLTALPPPTPYPTYTPYPPPASVPLEGLFCEYGFCIGHPAGLSLYDTTAVENALKQGQPIPSSYSGGKLNGYSEAQNLFILIVWQQGALDEQQMIETIAAAMGDTLTGSLQVELAGPYNLISRPFDPTPESSVLRSGLAAAWRCGDRTFGWKIYTDDPDRAARLLREAIVRFTCDATQ